MTITVNYYCVAYRDIDNQFDVRHKLVFALLDEVNL